MNILEHPLLKDLQSQTQRERLLYFKAYVEGFEAALRSVEVLGLEQARVIHEQTMETVSEDLEAKVRDGE